jgi:predicted site-specific integrase-resolvase
MHPIMPSTFLTLKDRVRLTCFPDAIPQWDLITSFTLTEYDGFLTDRSVMVAQKRVAIYARVSTLDKGQDPETQLLALREYAAWREFVVVGEYVDYASGTREDRPQYQALCAAARTRQVDVVLVWRYDRFARSTQALVQALQAFHSLGVDFISYQEQIDTTTPQGEMIFTVMASLAQFESALISKQSGIGYGTAWNYVQRVKQGLVPAGREG